VGFLASLSGGAQLDLSLLRRTVEGLNDITPMLLPLGLGNHRESDALVKEEDLAGGGRRV
jgi:hypothetical protein